MRAVKDVQQKGPPHLPLVGVVVTLSLVMMIIILHVYCFCCHRRIGRFMASIGRGTRSRRRFQFAEADITVPVSEAEVISISKGVDQSVLDALPMFYHTDKTEVLDCAVCLSEFEVNEAGRRLPRCNHVFHTECIDMWLGSHSTCPLCRASVVLNSVAKQEELPQLSREAVRVGLQGRAEASLLAMQILQEAGAMLYIDESHHRPRDHVVVNVDAPSQCFNSPARLSLASNSGYQSASEDFDLGS